VWKWVGENEKQIKIVFTLIAAAYVVFEYQVKIKQDHIANSLEYVRRYADGKIFNSRERLDAFWLSKLVMEENQKLQAEPNTTIRIKRYHEIIPHLLRTSGQSHDVYKILQFYRDVGLCVHARRCDRETVCNYFFTDMQSFRENYRALLEGWTQSIGETAPRELSLLVQQDCTDKFTEYCKKKPGSPYCTDSQ
jgi:hypothetical protein